MIRDIRIHVYNCLKSQLCDCSHNRPIWDRITPERLQSTDNPCQDRGSRKHGRAEGNQKKHGGAINTRHQPPAPPVTSLKEQNTTSGEQKGNRGSEGGRTSVQLINFGNSQLFVIHLVNFPFVELRCTSLLSSGEERKDLRKETI